MDLLGSKQMQRKLAEMGQKGNRLQNKALRASGQVLSEEMSERVKRSNRDHAHTEDHIVLGRVKKDDFGGKHIEVGPDKEVAWRSYFLVYGTSKMRPHDYMTPSYQSKTDEIYEAQAAVMKKGLGL